MAPGLLVEGKEAGDENAREGDEGDGVRLIPP
jgi:hypothetical protein